MSAADCGEKQPAAGGQAQKNRVAEHSLLSSYLQLLSVLKSQVHAAPRRRLRCPSENLGPIYWLGAIPPLQTKGPSFMAVAPTPAQVERAILDIVTSQKVRAGEVFNVTNVSVQLQQRNFRADEINNAFASLVEREVLAQAPSPKFLKLTELGFAEL